MEPQEEMIVARLMKCDTLNVRTTLFCKWDRDEICWWAAAIIAR